MRDVVCSGVPFEMTVQDLPIPTILSETGAVVRITTSALCGPDPHVYREFSGGNPPWNMDHEALGYIAELESAVSSLSVGDYVIILGTLSGGHFQWTPQVGNYYSNGTPALPDAEYARVPFADAILVPVPLTSNTTNSTIKQDYLTFKPSDTVAVFGAGPVGLLAAYSAILCGASNVYSIDHVEARLERAASVGAILVNFVASDPVAQILAYEPEGVMRSIDAVGMEALNSDLEIEEDIIIQQMIAGTAPYSGIGVVGVHLAQPNFVGAPNEAEISPNITFPMTKPYAASLVDMIASGKAHPNFISTAVIGIEDAPEYYRRYDRLEEIKMFIQFPWAR
ncbi:GroES-like protein [Lentithecium fluviatile CBS 122367]|uniref:GroES-like protein n=1 Tax=Lentithecium fluviatile CBS 122367 TaxID=1168545 RepID=A0A6G1IZB1_9PLEO|nr:GroES-like protein [Lentithecium fluviatile CBS 122367]